MNRDTRSEYIANFTLQPMVPRPVKPRAIKHHTPRSNDALWAVLVVLVGAGAGLLLGLVVGPLGRVL